MSTRHYLRRFLGQHVQCHTPFGSFQGIMVHCSKYHVILAVTPISHRHPSFPPGFAASSPYRPYPIGPGGPVGPGGPGWGGPGYGGPGGPGWGGGGGGWHIAIPLAAIIGITALGMHLW